MQTCKENQAGIWKIELDKRNLSTVTKVHQRKVKQNI